MLFGCPKVTGYVFDSMMIQILFLQTCQLCGTDGKICFDYYEKKCKPFNLTRMIGLLFLTLSRQVLNGKMKEDVTT
jgi:hypothetical protein